MAVTSSTLGCWWRGQVALRPAVPPHGRGDLGRQGLTTSKQGLVAIQVGFGKVVLARRYQGRVEPVQLVWIEEHMRHDDGLVVGVVLLCAVCRRSSKAAVCSCYRGLGALAFLRAGAEAARPHKK